MAVVPAIRMPPILVAASRRVAGRFRTCSRRFTSCSQLLEFMQAKGCAKVSCCMARNLLRFPIVNLRSWRGVQTASKKAFGTRRAQPGTAVLLCPKFFAFRDDFQG